MTQRVPTMKSVVGRGVRSGLDGSRIDAALILVACLAMMAVFIFLAMLSPTFAIVSVAGASLLTTIVCLGLEKTGTAVVILAMACAPLNSVRPSEAVSFVTFADVFFLLGFALLAPIILFRAPKPPPLFVVGAAVLLVSGIFASLAASAPETSLNHMMRLVVAALGIPIAFMFWRPGKRVVFWLASAYVLGVLISVADAVTRGAEPKTGRYEGLTTHFNVLGITALFAACLVPYIASMSPPSRRWLAWGAGGVCIYGIWISGSRAALLVIILVALIYPLVNLSIKAAGALAFAGAIALIMASRILDQAGSDNALGRLQGDDTASYSDIERRNALALGIKEFKAHPLLGNGFEQALEAHNIYLEIAAAVGVIGLVGYLFILASSVLPLASGLRPHHQLAYPALSYIMVGMITNLLWDRYIWAVLALALVIPKAEGDPRENTHQKQDHLLEPRYGSPVEEGTRA